MTLACLVFRIVTMAYSQLKGFILTDDELAGPQWPTMCRDIQAFAVRSPANPLVVLSRHQVTNESAAAYLDLDSAAVSNIQSPPRAARSLSRSAHSDFALQNDKNLVAGRIGRRPKTLFWSLIRSTPTSRLVMHAGLNFKRGCA